MPGEVREYSGGVAAFVPLRIFFWLRQKLRCFASRPSDDGKMLAVEPNGFVPCTGRKKKSRHHKDVWIFLVTRTGIEPILPP